MTKPHDLRVCAIAECSNEYRSPKINSPFCPLCRASIGAWSKRPAAALLRRRSNLTRYGSRMDSLIEERHTNVVHINTARKRRHA